jgi:hypothetical protein
MELSNCNNKCKTFSVLNIYFFFWFAQHSAALSNYSNPLELTVIKNETFELKNDCKSLKVKLMSPPIQTFPDFDKKFVLHTDTSAFSYEIVPLPGL